MMCGTPSSDGGWVHSSLQNCPGDWAVVVEATATRKLGSEWEWALGSKLGSSRSVEPLWFSGDHLLLGARAAEESCNMRVPMVADEVGRLFFSGSSLPSFPIVTLNKRKLLLDLFILDWITGHYVHSHSNSIWNAHTLDTWWQIE